MTKNLSRTSGFLCLAIAFFIIVDLAPAVAPADEPSPAAPTTQPTTYDRAIKMLVAGDQASAEHIIQTSVESAIKNQNPPNVDEVFLMGVMTRSRFEIEKAAPFFVFVKQINPESAHGHASDFILQIDSKKDIDASFQGLYDLATQKPADPLLLWMAAVQCRSLNKPLDGVDLYASLCDQWNPGPVLVHQTFANMLDELGEFNDALPHRQLAVKLEPESWAYDGLGNTLTGLKRWKEADDAYTHSTTLSPDQPRYWRNWAISEQARGDKDAAAKLNAKAADLEKAAAAAEITRL